MSQVTYHCYQWTGEAAELLTQQRVRLRFGRRPSVNTPRPIPVAPVDVLIRRDLPMQHQRRDTMPDALAWLWAEIAELATESTATAANLGTAYDGLSAQLRSGVDVKWAVVAHGRGYYRAIVHRWHHPRCMD